MGVATLEIDGLQVKLVETDDRIVFHAQHPEHSGSYEPDSLAWWAKQIKPGMTVLDVGAYTGLYSIIAALRGAKVTALEPMPANFWRLRVNAARNKVKLTTIAAAASDHEGTATLHYNPNVPLTTGASLEEGIAKHADGVVVKCITIDSLGLQELDAMKIDVEWHEPCVLAGAMQTIERCRPVLLIETLDERMRERVGRMLPGYNAAVVLDTRNTLFAPLK
jgi:FkbM family methyltransferase